MPRGDTEAGCELLLGVVVERTGGDHTDRLAHERGSDLTEIRILAVGAATVTCPEARRLSGCRHRERGHVRRVGSGGTPWPTVDASGAYRYNPSVLHRCVVHLPI